MGFAIPVHAAQCAALIAPYELIATGATQKEILTTFTARQPLAKYEIHRADERSVIRRMRR
jgi:hypothetical protein